MSRPLTVKGVKEIIPSQTLGMGKFYFFKVSIVEQFS